MEKPHGFVEVLKLVMISLALVFAVSAFTMVLLKRDGGSGEEAVRTIRIPDPPAPAGAGSASEMPVPSNPEMLKFEVAERDFRQKRADQAVAALKARFEKDGKLPDRIVLETPTDRPRPVSEDTEADPNTAPLTIYPHEKRMEFDAFVVLDKSTLIEVLLAGPRGKLHESLLKTYVNAYDVWQGLALLGLKQSYSARFKGDMVELEGDRVIVEVQYTDEDGKEVTKRVEDLVYHLGIGGHMPYQGWVYAGSHFFVPYRYAVKVTPKGEVLEATRLEMELKDVPDPVGQAELDKVKSGLPEAVLEALGNTIRDCIVVSARQEKDTYGESIYVLECTESEEFLICGESENIIATWHWPTSILDNPAKEAGDDTLYRPFEGVVPAVGTKVRVIMRPDEKYNKTRPEARPPGGK
jgi:hypothetical protein